MDTIPYSRLGDSGGPELGLGKEMPKSMEAPRGEANGNPRKTWVSMTLVAIAALVLFVCSMAHGHCEGHAKMQKMWAQLTGEDSQLEFQPPTIPLLVLDPFFQVHMMAEKATDDVTRGWYGNVREMQGLIRVDGNTYRFLGACTGGDGDACPQAMTQVDLDIGTIRTDFVFEDPQKRIELRVTYMGTPYTDDEERFARPVGYVVHDVRSIDDQNHEVQLYLDASAEHAVFNGKDVVEWDGWEQEGLKGIRIGTVAQQFLHRQGDRMNLDWGFLHIAARPDHDEHSDNPMTIVRGGSADVNRLAFESSGKVSRTPDQNNPRPCGEINEKNKTVISISKDMQTVNDSKRHIVMVAYDDIYSVNFFGTKLMGYWRQQYNSIQGAMAAAQTETDDMLERAASHDESEFNTLQKLGGTKYALVTRLAYRQTLGALKLVWNEEKQSTWMFLKEISTNGDMNTVDVVYPASPALLYHNPWYLQKLLEPMLDFANNSTSLQYWKPFSPHELGVYPVANHGTKDQEPMPMENTGNMFFMILGILQRTSDHEWIQPFYPLLETWAKYLNQTLPFPAHQLCTDDFKGPLANNTNLAAKGIVALEAFAEICHTLKKSECDSFSNWAQYHAKTWMKTAREDLPVPHTKLAFGEEGSFSIVYNVLWQKLLNLGNKPFESYDAFVKEEISFYIRIANKYGTPLDSRDSKTKTDWLSWAAAMATSDEDFETLFGYLFRFYNESTVRVPLSDYFDTRTGIPQLHDFRDRPVVGAFYAKALIEEMKQI